MKYVMFKYWTGMKELVHAISRNVKEYLSLVNKLVIIQFTLMVVHGIIKPVHFCIWNIDTSHLEMSLIEMVIHYFKDKVESLDVYYLFNSKIRDCINGYVYNLIELFVSMYNNTIVAKNNPVQIINEVVVVFS